MNTKTSTGFCEKKAKNCCTQTFLYTYKNEKNKIFFTNKRTLQKGKIRKFA